MAPPIAAAARSSRASATPSRLQGCIDLRVSVAHNEFGMKTTKSRFLRAPVEPFTVQADAGAGDLLARMEKISFQGRNLATARRIWEKMLGADCTIFLGMAGALSAGGLRLVVAHLIAHRYIDCLVSTGANLYHDLHETRGRHHYLGSPHED